MKSLSPAELAAAVELNHAEWLRIEGQLPWAKFNDDGDVIRIFAGDTWPRNRVALARFTESTAHARVGEILALHQAHKVACNWIVGPTSRPVNLGTHLRAHGFRCMIHCPGMARDLDRIDPAPACPKGFRVECISGPAVLYPLTTERRRNRHQGMIAAAALKPQRVWYFAAIRGTRHVGSTALLDASGVAGVYNVEVLKEFRRQGLGSLLVHAALRKAQELGFQAAVLSASGLGVGIYERLGFREVCRISFWKFGKMRQLRD